VTIEHSDSFQKARALRFPVWSREDKPDQGIFRSDTRKRINDLEDHISLTAYYQGDLEDERTDCYDELELLLREWEDIEGWQVYREGKTDASIDHAKKQIRPDLARKIKAARYTIARLSEQIDRMERDASKASRIYTLLTGS
jgi:hypothetical protein